jgi:Uncharacterized alpha/beta hydrolase domain (DUF2235)
MKFICSNSAEALSRSEPFELIKSEGLIPSKFGTKTISHEEMERTSIAAWRSYRKKSVSWTNIVPVLCRYLRDAVLFFRPANWFHRRYDAPFWVSKKQAEKLDTVVKATREQMRHGDRVPIKFVGLFDTVEAFGVPLESLRSAIDKLIWPISFPIEEMSDKVLRVRHALSLDDERTTFHPIRIRRVKAKSFSERLLATTLICPKTPTAFAKSGSQGFIPILVAAIPTISWRIFSLYGCSKNVQRQHL